MQQPVAILAALLAVLAFILTLERHPRTARLFSIVPALVFCYFAPTLLNLAGIIPRQSPLYAWFKEYLLSASLVLLTLSLDVPALLRLGPKAGAMFAASTFGVMVGGPIALWFWKGALPADAWKAMSYLAGSWIGGVANAIALKESVGATDESLGPVIMVDVLISYSWMALLLISAARHVWFDRLLGADGTLVDDLRRRVGNSKGQDRTATTADWMTILAIAFGVAAAADYIADKIVALPIMAWCGKFLREDAWRAILATTAGVLLSFTPARRLETAGASRLGMMMLYLLVASIGAAADFTHLGRLGPFLGLGVTWIAIHAVILCIAGRLLRAPLFLLAVSSQANIGGPVSAPVVAAAFCPTLAPVGIILAIAGYVVGTYAGLVCVKVCQLVSGS